MGTRKVSDQTARLISERVKRILKERGIEAIKPFGKEVKIENFSRMLDGERNWTLPNLEKLAKKFNVPLSYFLTEHGEVPVVREIVAQESFSFPARPQEEPAIYWVTVPKLEETLSTKLYAVRIDDDSYLPNYKKGTTFIAQKETSEHIEDGDIVIYSSPNGNGHLGKVYFHNKKILLKPLNPLEFREMLLDQGQVKMMDRVLYIQLF